MKRLAAVLLILCMVIPQAAFADSMDISIKGGKNVKAGDIFVITVSYLASDIDWVDGELTYDTSVLSYVSGGTSSGDGGVVSLKEASDNGTSITFKVKFKAKGSGSAALSVSTNEAYDFSGRALDLSEASKTVKIEEHTEIAPDDEEEDIQEEEPEASDEQTDEEEEETSIEDVDRNVGPLNFYLVCGISVTAFLLVILLCIAARRKRRNRR